MSEFITRAEFEPFRLDLKAIEHKQAMLGTKVDSLHATLCRTNQYLEEQKLYRVQRDGVIKATIWLVGFLGPAGVGAALIACAKSMGVLH